ncbi:DUF2637 domain-containing protein [Streptomyces sp. Ru87]|uniref:DUF2637 domain-containing protein n=1 Tax=Streptomyces sp. Ru87 TaxID=2044307 RepID=UPI000BF72447|nr:DUF2637 domain-containing protein [Streptomyces sp. Ru87]PGH49314.1 hypothetical protein CRI70_18415 [Streptomyces sp. Ru87]
MSTALSSSAEAAEAARVPPLSKPERGLLGSVAVAAGAVGILGLVSSFDAVAGAAERWGFGTPWMLPVGIDVAIPVFTAANLLLIRVNMPLAWVRFVPWALTFVTCWLNVDAGDGMSAKLAHGTMPLLWVVLSEIAAHVYASRIGAVTGRRMEKIRRSRWLLAPLSTFALWRRMTLWEITSYTDALTRERQRQLDRAELRERYGRRWRKQTPRRTRVLLKLGELAPADAEPDPEPDPGAADENRDQARPKRRPRKTSGKAKPKSVRTPDELLAEARAVTAGWAEGELTAEAIRKAVRTSQASARTLRDALKAERADGRALYTVDQGEGVAA